MKIVKIIMQHKNAPEQQIKDFIYRNMSQEMINGLEYDDPKTIERALKMFGIDAKIEEVTTSNSTKEMPVKEANAS